MTRPSRTPQDDLDSLQELRTLCEDIQSFRDAMPAIVGDMRMLHSAFYGSGRKFLTKIIKGQLKVSHMLVTSPRAQVVYPQAVAVQQTLCDNLDFLLSLHKRLLVTE